jgi:micrococcal nuclease
MSRRATTSWVLLFLLLIAAGSGILGDIGGDEPSQRPPRDQRRDRSDRPGDRGRSDDSKPDTEAPGGGALTARVIHVVDGDTVRVRLDGSGTVETVRYIGIDTPESVKPGEPVQCFAKAASAFNATLVGGRRVRLRIGRERRDRYGRLLAYVYVLGPRTRFVNAELMRGGYARTLEIPPNTDFAGRFAALQRRAIRQRVGLWSACPAAQ